MNRPTVALAGNPNAGKSTIFNLLTGSRQHTGNWPGKTVEKKEGILGYRGRDIRIVDLPGTYSLSAYSIEEQIARDFLIEERPDMIVDVVDAANLERNLYLTVQLLETGIPMILALNMMDIAQARQITIDPVRISEMLHHTPVIPMIASKGSGIEALKEAIVTLSAKITSSSPPMPEAEPDVHRGVGSPRPRKERNG